MTEAASEHGGTLDAEGGISQDDAVFEESGDTGVPAVDEALAGLDGLEDRPVEEHPAVFESAHGALRAVLGSGGS